MGRESEVDMATMTDGPDMRLAEADRAALRQRGKYGFEDAHWVAGFVAAAISLAVHVLIAWGASWVDFSGIAPGGDRRADPQWSEPMQVESVDPTGAEAQVLDVLQTLDVGEAQGTAAEALDELERSPDAASVEPPAITMPEVELDLETMQAMEPPALDEMWQPRQEILAIETEAVAGEPLDISPRRIPAIARVPDAPDLVFPVDVEDMTNETSRALFGGVAVGQDDALGTQSVPQPEPSALLEGTAKATGETTFGEDPVAEEAEDVTDVTNIEHVLQTQVETFEPEGSAYGYFRVRVQRAGKELLPVRPKDVLLVQDTSSTIAERRLRFSRRAMLEGIELLASEDRFNVATFVGQTRFCFPGWARNTPENRAKARAFIEAMEAEGNTDFLRSMRDLLTLPVAAGRPALALVITDGIMHSGETDSSEVIGAFTRENDGRLSIYTVGVADYANAYLLDMLSYSNMGGSYYVRAGRWDIPETILGVLRSVQRPVLSGLRFRFATDSGIEGFPIRPGNLYLDRPLTLYGRYPAGLDTLTFQAIGRAGDEQSDMMYTLPLGPETRSRNAQIRDAWSLRKIYHLIGVYTKDRDREALQEMRRISREYDQPIPYRRAFWF